MEDKIIKRTATVLYPVLKVLFYVTLVVIAVLLILSFIILFINVDTDEMLMPPLMKRLDTGYNIYLGGGVKIYTPDATLSQIKSVCWIGIFSFIAFSLVALPIIKFIALISKNVKVGDYTNPKNSRYIIYIGLIWLVGGTFVGILSDFFNYRLFNIFVNEATGNNLIFYSFGIEAYTILFGLAIMAFGCVYNRLCTPKTSVVHVNDNETNV